jgi:mannose/fructose/N-acetylgalactosamine-specific phosphotransferase system component IIC
MKSLQFLFLALFAGMIHLDTMVFGQFMISRPIVVGPLVGYFLNSVETGFLIGVIVELIYISIIPVGIKIPPDATATTILAVMCSNIIECNGIGLSISIFLGTIFGLLYKFTDIQIRTLNNAYLSWVDTAKPEYVERRINLLVHYGILISFLRTVLFYLIVFPMMYFLIKNLCIILQGSIIKKSVENIVYILPAIGIGIGIAHFREK